MLGKRKVESDEPRIGITLRKEPFSVYVSIPVYSHADEQAWRRQVIANGEFRTYAPQIENATEHFSTTIELLGTPDLPDEQIKWLCRINEVDPQALPRTERQIAEYIEYHDQLSLPQRIGLRRIAGVAREIVNGLTTIAEHEGPFSP